ncbi:hypothetical protein VDGL01_06314 [Verticillium dahliae]
MVVLKASAVVPGYVNAESFKIPLNYTSMVRYISDQEPGYKTVSEHLQIMVMDVPVVVQGKWQVEARVHAGTNT